MKTITPNLWFDGNAKEAVDFYVSVFPDSKIKDRFNKLVPLTESACAG